MLQAGERSPQSSKSSTLLLNHATYVLCKLLAAWLCLLKQWLSIIESVALHRYIKLISFSKP